jgi:hypothetical protein
MPGSRPVQAFALMAGLTLASMAAGLGGGHALPHLPGWAIVLVLGAAFLKARLLLLDYLELRGQADGWRNSLLLLLAAVLMLVGIATMRA